MYMFLFFSQGDPTSAHSGLRFLFAKNPVDGANIDEMKKILLSPSM